MMLNLKKMVSGFINHFLSDKGTDYSSDILNKKAAAHQSTKNFKNHVSVAFQKEIDKKEFKDDGSFKLTELNSIPRYQNIGTLGYGTGDEDNGLAITVNAIWTYSLKIVSYKEVEGKYTAELALVMYDTYGLDPLDITDHVYADVYLGFTAWYVLQWGRGYSSFTTVITIPNFTVTGDVPTNR